MNILFFNRSFYPDIEATGQLLTELCESLTKTGHNITVISGRSYYVKSERNFFLIESDKYNSINIFRTNGTIFPKRFLILRIINLGSYFLLSLIAGFYLRQKPDIIVVGTDPPVLGLLGVLFSKWYRAKFIYYCQDIYPDVGIATGRLKNLVINFFLERINQVSFNRADKIICIGEFMKSKIIAKRITESKITVIHNWADTEKLYPIAVKENKFVSNHKLENYFTIMYSGNIGFTQNLEKVIKVASCFQNVGKVKFLLVGEGANKVSLQKIVKNLNLLNLEFLPYQLKDELRFSLNAPNIHIVSFEKGLSGIMVPSKVYSILACGKPYIAWVDRNTEIYDIAHKFKCGIAVPPDDIRNMVRAINWAIKHPEKLKEMGNNGRNAVLKFYDLKNSLNKFNQAIFEVLSY